MKFFIRECDGIDSFAVFRYDYGIEHKQNIDNFSEEELELLIQEKINGADRVNKSL